MGVDRATANRMVDVSIDIITQSSDIKRFRSKRDSDAAFFEQHRFAERILEYIQKHHRRKLSKHAAQNLTEIIADRVSGVNGEDEFHERIERKISSGGLGVKGSESDDITRYMEKLIAMGVDVSYKS